MINDPVTGFIYPDSWVNRCPSPELLEDVRRGLAVLTASGKVLKRGYSTGTTAAAACAAAVLSLGGEVQNVSLVIPCGLTLSIPVVGKNGEASCIKFAGDYGDDVTAGVEILATAAPISKGITLRTGIGIGRYTRTTLRFKKGDPAISKSAIQCIRQALYAAIRNKG
ncbi:MAG: cobalt-precorrin-5B (C(1))-methyltransferase, partial [Methanomicrobiales archaeon]|nr:cobalt-precorrin-5B (C(1))-methyltransferase [Methanomicrobiales archaeon]